MLKGVGLAYEEVGAGEPILFIHGGAIADAFLRVTQEPVLAERYRLVRYRRRGFFDSDPVERPGTITAHEYARRHAMDAGALLEHLGIERAHVVGHSGGGLLTVQLALEAPNLVHSIVLMEPALLAMKQSWADGMRMMIEPAMDAARDDPEKAAKMVLTFVEGPNWRDLAATHPGGPQQWISDTKDMLFEFRDLLDWSFGEADAKRITQPVLFMTGGASPSFHDQVKDLFTSWGPRTESVVIPDQGHHMHFHDAPRVAQAIADFVSRHPLEPRIEVV